MNEKYGFGFVRSINATINHGWETIHSAKGPVGARGTGVDGGVDGSARTLGASAVH